MKFWPAPTGLLMYGLLRFSKSQLGLFSHLAIVFVSSSTEDMA